MRLVDAHCHLDLYPDFGTVLQEIEGARVYTLAVTNTPSVFRRSSAITRGARYVRTAIGLHPELAKERERELPLFDELLPSTRYVGEIGLDYVTQDSLNRKAQRRVFQVILDKCAPFGNKVLTIHSRRSAGDVVAMVGAGYPGRVILHWFSGSLSTLNTALAYGCYFSINTPMLSTATGRRLIAALPPDRVLTETDGPFTLHEGRPSRPANVSSTISALAQLWNDNPCSTARRVLQNFQRVIDQDT